MGNIWIEDKILVNPSRLVHFMETFSMWPVVLLTNLMKAQTYDVYLSFKSKVLWHYVLLKSRHTIRTFNPVYEFQSCHWKKKIKHTQK